MTRIIILLPCFSVLILSPLFYEVGVYELSFHISDISQYTWAVFKWLIYLTNISYLVLSVQSTIHLVIIVCYWRKGKTQSSVAGKRRLDTSDPVDIGQVLRVVKRR